MNLKKNGSPVCVQLCQGPTDVSSVEVKKNYSTVLLYGTNESLFRDLSPYPTFCWYPSNTTGSKNPLKTNWVFWHFYSEIKHEFQRCRRRKRSHVTLSWTKCIQKINNEWISSCFKLYPKQGALFRPSVPILMSGERKKFCKNAS